jgi:predicted ATP-binding protein involved in virulence
LIKAASVLGLLGLYNHRVHFDEEWEFAIAYGLNGVGKTKFLELIHAALRLELHPLARIEYASLLVETDDGESLEVVRHDSHDESSSAWIEITLFTGGAVAARWSSPSDIGGERFEQFLLGQTPWRSLDSVYWQDQNDDEIADIDELRMRYGSRWADGGTAPTPAYPDELKRFSSRNPSLLIDTGRLSRPVSRTNAPRPQNRSPLAVDSFARDLRSRLERALAQNSVLSQTLDRSYPARVLRAPLNKALSEPEIRRQFAELDARRERLAEIGLIGQRDDVSLPSKGLEAWQRSVLSVYLTDAADKIETLSEVVQRVNLLERLLNARLLNKTIRVTKEKGLSVYSSHSDREIPVTGLSSGEQHELVLFYSLLFSVAPGSLVLIDEPEISLHVSWQKRFLQDILEISHANSVRFLLATHSPQIIGKWWSRTEELGPETGDR